ncbi:MAG: ExbD/TolR family protein [Nitrospinota bacterium]|nr:ExbD/TolR family protein [Nitrospinota bacterium]
MMQDTGGKRFRRKASTLLTEINVTPFVDVVLVLLIIFMVTTPMMQSGVQVELPKEDAGAMEIKEENVITIDKDGALFFNDKRVAHDDLDTRLKSIAITDPAAQVYLRADRRVAYGAVMDILAMMKNSGVLKIGMVTDPEQEK